jgi:hypothetical protein
MVRKIVGKRLTYAELTGKTEVETGTTEEVPLLMATAYRAVPSARQRHRCIISGTNASVTLSNLIEPIPV